MISNFKIQEELNRQNHDKYLTKSMNGRNVLAQINNQMPLHYGTNLLKQCNKSQGTINNSQSKLHEIGQNSLQLIQIDQNGKFKIPSEVILSLQNLSLKKEKISFCSIVGKSKTGKSFLLNELINNNKLTTKKSSFPINHTLVPCTKGIYISKDPLLLENNSNCSNNLNSSLIFLDTQGFGLHQSTQQTDYKLFLLTLLLSDIICFNNIGPIDEQTINSFSLGIEISKMFKNYYQQSSKQESKSFSTLKFPKLLWILRDFSLEFIDKNNKTITTDEYLENCLKEERPKNDSKVNKKRDHKNKIRKSIKQIFENRKCSSLVLPFDEQGLIRQEFGKGTKQIKEKLQFMINEDLKTNINQNKVQSFIYRLKALVNYLNSSNNSGKFEFPKIQNISDHIKKLQMNSLFQNIQKQCLTINKKYENLIEKAQKKSKSIEDYLKKLELLKGEMQNQIFIFQSKYNQKLRTFWKNNIFTEDEKNQSRFLNTQSKISQSINSFRSKLFNKVEKIQGQINQKINSSSSRNNFELNFEKFVKSSIISLQNILQSDELQTVFIKITNEFQIFQTYQQQSEYQPVNRLFNTESSINEIQDRNSSLISYYKKQIEMEYLKRKIQLLSQQKQAAIVKKRNYTNPEILMDSKKSVQQSKVNLQLSSYSTNGYTQCTNCNKSFYIPYIIIKNSNLLKIIFNKSNFKKNKKGQNCIEFSFQLSLNQKTWNIQRKIKDFEELKHIITIMFPNVELPVCELFIINDLTQQQSSSFYNSLKSIQSAVYKYFKELSQTDLVRNTRIFQKFIKINKQYIHNLQFSDQNGIV